MSCNCKLLQRRLEKMQKKYITLKRNHKRLLGISILLTDALEQLIKGEVKTGINETLSSCSTIYPDLFGNIKTNHLEVESINMSNECTDESEKNNEPATESQREYFEGFLARPKIPRTPQV